ncbi:MAG: Hpt domain-containing protein [Gammaproteobacteria bacterium]|nr:Hpt domain-containing protein [Gammaproteobacteria bacterium]
MNSKSKQSVIELLQALKTQYASELSSKIDEIELNILSLDKNGYFPETLRQIHSMKGSAGTHGFMTVSSICHHMEDYLALVDANKIQPVHIDKLLQYIDLLQQASRSIIDGHDDNQRYEKILHALASPAANVCRVLIVDNSKAIPALIRKELESQQIIFTSVEDGYQALGLLLMKKYDLLITSEEIGPLNGSALIAGIKNSNSANKNIKVIHLTSGQNKASSESTLADYKLHKDASVANHVRGIINKLN